MAGARKVVATTPSAQKPEVAKDPQTKTSGVEDHEQLKHELREAVTAALKSTFAKPEADPRTRFHEQFRKEADEYDHDFHKKYHDDLNTTLLFAGLFSAVASAFIVDVQTQIRPDYNQMNFVVLTMLLNATSGIPSDIKVPTVTGPNEAAVEVQAILFGSLASALLAAFLATLGKQWLNLHVDGSFIHRNRHRELKMRGMITWRFRVVMECLPLIMQGSLLLLGYALAQYFWDLSRKVSSVIVAFTAFGLIFYLFIVVAGTASEACPFQTPASVFLRTIQERCGEDVRTAIRVAWSFFGLKRPQSGLITHRHQTPTFPVASSVEDRDGEVRADLRCIYTMFRMTKALDSTVAIMKYIPEITWDSRLESVPLLPVYQALQESLWRSADGRVFPRPGAKDRAFSSAKALLYMYLQRRCIHSDDKTLASQVKLMDHQKQPLACPSPNGDPDLESTFYIIDWTFGFQSPIPWSDFELSEPHRHWLSHILQYRAWDAIRTRGKMTEDVRGFVQDSLNRSTSLDSVVADCLFVIYMVVGHRPQTQELLIKDRSHQATELVDRIFSRLEVQFEQGMSAGNISTADEALSLVVMVPDERIGEKSFALFRKIMGLVKNDNRLWESARLMMKGAFSPIARVPRVDDLKMILEFLHHYISSQRRSAFGDEPIYHSFRAIADSSDDRSRPELVGYFTSPLFIDTIIHALSNKGYKDLQGVAIVVLPGLDSHLFASDKGFQAPGKAQAFVDAWWGAVESCRTDKPQVVDRAAAQAFFTIVNSPCLREHIPPDAWGFTDSFHYLLEANPPSLQRCTQNPDLLAFVKRVSPKVGLPSWMAMLWMEYNSLSKDVLDQMEKETRETVYRECEVSGTATMLNRTRYCKSWISIFNVYLGAWEKRLGGLDPSDQAVPSLRARQESAIRARKRLIEIQDEVERDPPPASWCWQ